ncbi:unnamed protein product [Arctogadus glacialis]
MAEAIHPGPNMMTEVRTTRGDGEEKIVDILRPGALGDRGTERVPQQLVQRKGRSQQHAQTTPGHLVSGSP